MILKENSATDVIIPKYEDEKEKASDNMIIAVAIATLIPTDEFKELINKTITKLSENFDKEVNEEE